MNIFKWLLQKKQPTTEVKPVTDQVVEVAQANSATTTVQTTTVTTDDAVLAKVKELLISIGHDVEAEFDKVVELAKTLVAKS